MAINFPNSPSVNDIHSEGGIRWKWNGSSWTRASGAAVTDTITTANDNSTTTLYPVMTSGTGGQTAKIATTATKNISFDASDGNLTVGGNISVGGTITYEDVTNIDSVGIITAREGIKINADSKNLLIGASGDLRLQHDGSNSFIDDAGTGALRVRGSEVLIQKVSSTENMFRGVADGAAELYFNAVKKFETMDSGVQISGITSSTNLNVTGISTFGGALDINAGVNISGLGDFAASTFNNLRLAYSGDSEIDTSSGNLILDSAGGTVQVTDNFSVTGDVDIADKIVHTGDTNTAIRFPAADTVSVETAGAERLRITSTGVVSINDSTPETFATLQVKNHTGSNAAQFLLHGADMAQIILRDDTGGSNTKCTTIRNDQGAFLVGTHNDSYGGFSEKLRIKSDGNITTTGKVGIGNRTSTPDENLHVHTSSGQANIHVEGATDGQIILRAHSGDSVIHFGDASSTSVGKIVYDHGTDSLQFNTGSNERLSVDSSGLDVTGTITLDAVAGTNTNANLAVLFQTAAGVIDGGSSLLFNPAEDVLKVNGSLISSSYLYGSAGTLKLAAANHSSTSYVSVTSFVSISMATDKVVRFSGGIGEIGNVTGFQATNDANNALTSFGMRASDLRFATGSSERLKIHSTGQVEFKNGSFSNNVDCVMANGGTMEIGAQSTIKLRTATNETVRIDNNQRIGIGPNAFSSPVFGQSTPITSYNPKVGIDGSIILGNLSTGTTSRHQLQFYRRNGTSTGQSISSHNMGEIAWYGSSNDGDNSNMAWSIGVTATGGNWTSGANRTGRMLFTNHDGEMARFTEKGVFNGRAVINYDSTSGNSRWTTSGSWKVVVDLSGWPQNCLYICDAAMQFSGSYTATFWVYKTRQGTYQVVHDQDSLCHWRINGSQIEIQQNSGVDQTNTSGYQKVWQAFGMH